MFLFAPDKLITYPVTNIYRHYYGEKPTERHEGFKYLEIVSYINISIVFIIMIYLYNADGDDNVN